MYKVGKYLLARYGEAESRAALAAAFGVLLWRLSTPVLVAVLAACVVAYLLPNRGSN
jgi:hypothetical protein